MRAQAKARKSKNVKTPPRLKPLKYIATCPKCKKVISLSASAMSPSPKCPKCGALLNYDVTLGVYRCPQCRKIVCPFCVVVMDPYTFGRYKCPKCGYISSSPSGT